MRAREVERLIGTDTLVDAFGRNSLCTKVVGGKVKSGPCPTTGEFWVDNGKDARWSSARAICLHVSAKKAPEVDKAAEQPDPVNHPSHYTSLPAFCTCGRRIECIDISEQLPGNRAQALQYIWRAGSKGGIEDAIEDLRKAARFSLREADRLARENGLEVKSR